MIDFKDIIKVFRIKLSADNNVSKAALRQYCRCVEAAIDGKEIYRVTSPDGKITYHATISDIVRFFYTKGLIGVQSSNIHQAARQCTKAYNHIIEHELIDLSTLDLESI